MDGLRLACMLIDSPMIFEKGFRRVSTSTTAITVAIKVNKNASDKNCLINWAFVDPVTFRIPTSFALLDALAVERFIKFTQARRMMNKAMLPKMYTYLILLIWLSQGMLIEEIGRASCRER